MSKKNTVTLPFDDRSLPENTMFKDRMTELESKFSPFIKEALSKLKDENLQMGKQLLKTKS